ncbi:MAG: beta-eliminating lyase-related protein [Eubacteriales bacterium]|nr:beta-eliminating lyase-related protein [Eubacteriales bacterium]
MIFLECDYNNGAHSKVMEALLCANTQNHATYGYDVHSQNAQQIIRDLCQKQDLQAYFLAGGTQVNRTFIRSCLRVYEGVLSTKEGHIATHETGAIESDGHKVLCVPGGQGAMAGKVDMQSLQTFLQGELYDPANEHVVNPGMLYISQPTETGTMYSEQELKNLRALCDAHGLLLYCDGARLASAIAHYGKSMWQTLAQTCDAFYIGGTKCGALFGEALVICNPALNQGLKHVIKQSGALMAKGYVIAAQFEALLQNDLYQEIGAHNNALAKQIAIALQNKGYELTAINDSNQVFAILPQAHIAVLSEHCKCMPIAKLPNQMQEVRFVTSHQNTQAEIDTLLQVIAQL